MKEQEGNHWGHLTVVSVYSEYEKIPRSGGFDTMLVSYMDLKCDCGNTITMKVDDFVPPLSGRRHMRDCGCGIADSQHVNATAYLKADIHLFLAKEARLQGISMSRLMSDVMEDYVRRVQESMQDLPDDEGKTR